MIEDLYPNQYVAQFLAPMLENAGAVVWNLRERDFQSAEVIVDNEGADALSTFRATAGWTSGGAPGWKGGRPPRSTPPRSHSRSARICARWSPRAPTPLQLLKRFTFPISRATDATRCI
jgi:hypothetical protein